MLPAILCPHCGVLVAESETTPGAKVVCVSCRREFLARSVGATLLEQNVLRMGDDDGGGGGGWGGGGDDSSSSESEDDDDEEEGEDGKKKKKKKKGGMFSGLIMGIIGVALLCCCCVPVGGIAYMFGWLPTGTPFVGKWDSVAKFEIPDIGEDGKDEGKKISVLLLQLEINGSGEKGSGIVTELEDAEKKYSFEWSKHDPAKKTVVFTVDKEAKRDTVIGDIKSPATFEYKIEGNKMTLTPSGEAAKAMEFTRVVAPKAEPAKKKGKRK
ncbi:MAG: hypothetical protein HY289_12845 [Planctomycetes bacterium]|nr:hypothetical protein [Planctomycetota bacterium]